jgi:hypothetical protein
LAELKPTVTRVMPREIETGVSGINEWLSLRGLSVAGVAER